jgi:hypothetical protein
MRFVPLILPVRRAFDSFGCMMEDEDKNNDNNNNNKTTPHFVIDSYTTTTTPTTKHRHTCPPQQPFFCLKPLCLYGFYFVHVAPDKAMI